MKRRDFLKLTPLAAAPLLPGCGYLRADPMHALLRSPVIDSLEKEQEILSKAKLEWTEDGKMRVLYTRGTPYECGYQQGKLLRKEVQDNIGFIYEQGVRKFRFPEFFAEVWERMRPYMPQDYVDELHGLAHGSRLPLHVLQHAHIFPDFGEWGGKKKLKKVINQMLAGELATTCSNFSVARSATPDGKQYSVRVLDWGMHRISRLHHYPLFHVQVPNEGLPSCNATWVGFIGCVSGINSEGITIGEMGYGDNEFEKLEGTPMPMMLREIMRRAKNLADVRRLIQETPPTASYVFLMTDGKTEEAELYVRDPSRFLVFHPNEDIKDKKEHLPPIPDTVYGGHFNEKMTELLTQLHGKINPELIMKDIIPKIAMKSNFQNVIYEPKELKVWFSIAKSRSEWAADQPYTFFDFRKALAKFKQTF